MRRERINSCKFRTLIPMCKAIKILLFVAALLYSGSTTYTPVTLSENKSPAFDVFLKAASATLDTPDIPFQVPADRRAEQVTYLSECFSDSNLKESQKEQLYFSEFSVLDRKRVYKILNDSRIIDFGFTIQKIIYPFHSFF